MTLISTFENCLLKAGKKYSNLVVLTPDCLEEAGVEQFAKYFSERFINFGKAESAMALSAVGLNAVGKMPILAVDSQYAARCFDQIKRGICEENLNVKVVAVGNENCDDLELVRLMPNMKIVEINDEKMAKKELCEMMESYGPVYLRIFDDRAIYNREQGVL